jgi:hypothetical protein
MMGAARLRLAVEEHGGGTQLVRMRSWPRYSGVGALITALLAVLAAAATLDGAPIAGVTLGAAALFMAISAVRECAAATGVLLHALVEPKPVSVPLGEARSQPAGSASWSPVPDNGLKDVLSENGHDGAGATSVGDLPPGARIARLTEPE